ncbi:MAG: hypothetical protein AB1797_03690 [bacterium]
MKYAARAFFAAAIALALMLSACGKQPTLEINDAKAAIEVAVREGGEKYAKDEVKALNDELNVAMEEVKTQDAKFLKNYDRAKEMLAQVKSKAETLQAEIPAKKEKAKNDATAALEAAKTAIADAKALLDKAPTGKGTTADIEALKADVTGLEASLTETEGLIAGEDYFAAIEDANGISAKAAEVSTQVTQALEKVGKSVK